MPESYTEFVELVDELIGEFGRTARLLSTTRDPNDSTKPWNGPTEWDDATAPVEKFAEIVAAFIGRRLSLTSGQVAGRTFSTLEPYLTNTANDIFLVSGSATQDFSKFDKLLDGEEVWNIINVAVIQPGSVVVAYAIEVYK